VSNIAAPSFDVLAIVENMSTTIGGITEPEIYVFAYLACLLSLYDGKDTSWWTYKFTATQAGAPYSKNLSDGSDLLVAGGLLKQGNDVLELTARGRAEVELLDSLSGYSARRRYLSAACDCALTLPLAAIREVLGQEPQLRSAIELMQTRPLLDEAGMALLRPHLEGLRAVLADSARYGGDRDLLVPAVLWLTYLDDEANKGWAHG
jgi:hypothetical protein